MRNDLIDAKEKQRLIEELEALGISKGFIELKEVDNLYIAQRVVSEYDFGREITDQERRVLLQAILSNALLNKNNKCRLSTLIQNLEQMGLQDQEIYAIIINLGVNGKILDERAYAYTDLLRNKNYACQSIAEYKDKIEKRVGLMTILAALSNGLNEEEENELTKELEDLGISIDFIKLKDISNIYIAKTVVESYDMGKELTPQEKRVLIQAILNISLLNRNGKKQLLSRLMQRFEQIGLNEQEIYGTIINLGVNGKVLEEAGYSYSELLANKDNVCQIIAEYKDKIDKRVGKMKILTAISTSLEEKEEQELKKELETLGISRAFIDSKDISNLYMAKRIVDDYDFGRELTSKEKRALMYAVLDNYYLNNRYYLSTLMQKFEQMGLEEQDIYGTIINLGVNGRVLKEVGYAYSDLLSNKDNACQTIEAYKDKIETRVGPMTILAAFLAEERARRKAEKMMQKALKARKDKGAISEQAETRAEIESLVKQELVGEQEKNQEISSI